ncbi:DUF5320 domain-containing protein [Mobilitalea sibirica]|uniref:DUF5320 domain-containing protein n=1 Tax=Mobilitalea sibirica TaxID=1462919 RepID=A0A8J7KVQ2_9FIRM|nr:DUF5320 domain-containing protein [Mobilitalea sibirica]MBH1939432.1 DUF5320 domain-containing protein [Mobilitalea sibirica]
MPRGDGSGPIGLGAKTGRGAGFCSGYTTPGYANFVGRPIYGYGRGNRRFHYPTGIYGQRHFRHPDYDERYTSDYDEKEFLTRQAKYLEEQLRFVRKNLSKYEEDDK